MKRQGIRNSSRKKSQQINSASLQGKELEEEEEKERGSRRKVERRLPFKWGKDKNDEGETRQGRDALLR